MQALKESAIYARMSRLKSRVLVLRPALSLALFLSSHIESSSRTTLSVESRSFAFFCSDNMWQYVQRQRSFFNRKNDGERTSGDELLSWSHSILYCFFWSYVLGIPWADALVPLGQCLGFLLPLFVCKRSTASILSRSRHQTCHEIGPQAL